MTGGMCDEIIDLEHRYAHEVMCDMHSLVTAPQSHEV